MAVAVDSLSRRFEALRPHLNERQRRLWLGAEARELGPGGEGVVAAAVGVAADTVRRGRAELDDPAPAPVGSSRKAGGGRKRAEAHDPALVAALEQLVDPDSRGDPMSPLRWTSKSTRTLATALRERGHQVSEFVVRRLLKALGYSLQANIKTAEGRQHPDRDAQFGYLNDQVKAHQNEGCPVISVDTKKKELVGNYRNSGREWQPTGDPTQVNVYDFLDTDLGKAIPYGVYDLARGPTRSCTTGWPSRSAGARPRWGPILRPNTPARHTPGRNSTRGRDHADTSRRQSSQGKISGDLGGPFSRCAQRAARDGVRPAQPPGGQGEPRARVGLHDARRRTARVAGPFEALDGP